MTGPREFHYRAAEAATGHFPGAHRSRRGESGFEFRGHARLMDAPDVRRLDLRASLRDPFGDWRVRVFSQRRAIDVVLVADLSASMAFEGRLQRHAVSADFVESLAWSAWRNGDRFAFVGCGDTVLDDWWLPATRSRGAGHLLAQRLRTTPPAATSAHGLLDAHRRLGRRRSLVFLLSDFHAELEAVDRVLDSLSSHDVVPVLAWDPLETGPQAAHGLARLRDAETGRERLLWWRPSLRERQQRERDARLAALEALFRRHRADPILMIGAFDPDAVTRHFYGSGR